MSGLPNEKSLVSMLTKQRLKIWKRFLKLEKPLRAKEIVAVAHQGLAHSDKPAAGSVPATVPNLVSHLHAKSPCPMEYRGLGSTTQIMLRMPKVHNVEQLLDKLPVRTSTKPRGRIACFWFKNQSVVIRRKYVPLVKTMMRGFLRPVRKPLFEQWTRCFNIAT